MKLEEIITPVNGVFTRMPQDIWGGELDPSFMDIELFTRIGQLEASPTARYFATNQQQLADMLYSRYHKNWERIWAALLEEYDIMLTSTMDETRTTQTTDARTSSTVEAGTSASTTKDDSSTTGTGSDTGTVSTKADEERVRDLTDLETRALTASETRDLTDLETRALQLKKTGTDTLATDTETTGASGNVKTLTGSTTNEKTISGAENTTTSATRTGNGTTATTERVAGVGGSSMVDQSQSSVTEAPNFSDGGTSNLVYSGRKDTDVETFANRKDSDEGTSSENVEGTETRTLNTTDADTGTVTNKATGTSETTNAGTVTNKGTGSETTDGETLETRDLASTSSQIVDGTSTTDVEDSRTISGQIDDTGVTEDTFHSEGSSPLRTYQALIHEEIEGRSGQVWNFTDIVIKDVQTIIASKIWKREFIV